MNDDHNRYRIATEHGLTYETVQKDFKSREHALNWIISNQLGRRSLNPNQIAYLRGKRYETEKKIWGGDRKSDEFEKSSSQSGNLIPDPSKTNENLAKEYGVGKSTISRNAKFSKVVDILPADVKETTYVHHQNKLPCMPNANLKDKPKTYDVIAEEMKALRKTNQPYIL